MTCSGCFKSDNYRVKFKFVNKFFYRKLCEKTEINAIHTAMTELSYSPQTKIPAQLLIWLYSDFTFSD